jgi:hypothetical protein
MRRILTTVLALSLLLGATAVARAATVALTATVTAGTPLAVSTPATASFALTLDGTDQTSSYALPLTVVDPRGNGAGWSLTIGATQFDAGSGHTLPTNASTMALPTQSCGASSTCTPATNAVGGYPLGVPTTGSVKFFNAAVNTGLGKIVVTPTVSVVVPANVFSGSYTSTVTVTIATGP